MRAKIPPRLRLTGAAAKFIKCTRLFSKFIIHDETIVAAARQNRVAFFRHFGIAFRPWSAPLPRQRAYVSPSPPMPLPLAHPLSPVELRSLLAQPLLLFVLAPPRYQRACVELTLPKRSHFVRRPSQVQAPSALTRFRSSSARQPSSKVKLMVAAELARVAVADLGLPSRERGLFHGVLAALVPTKTKLELYFYVRGPTLRPS